MATEPEDYRNLSGVNSVTFDGYVDTKETYEGSIEAELDETVLQVWLRDVPLSDIAGGMDFEVDEVYGITPDYEIAVHSGNQEEILQQAMFSGVGFEMDSGPTVYVEHPTRYTTGMAESDPHQHVEYLLNGKVEFDAGEDQENVEEAVEFGEQLLNRIGEAEDEREKRLWNEWADETGYRDKGKLGRLWLRITSTGPDGLGPKQINPYGCIDDLDRSGLPADELFDTSREF